MYAIPEQFSTAAKANFDAQLNTFTALSGKAFEGVEKLIDLNMSVVRASLDESAATAKQLLSVKDPQEFFAVASLQVQPAAQKAVAYGRHVANIASSTQAEFNKAADAQITENNRKVVALIDEVSKNAPAGSETVIALVKSAIGNTNASFEQLSKVTKQAIDAIEANLATATEQYVQTAEKATKSSKK